MVQITEYTKRETADFASNGSTNLSLPKALYEDKASHIAKGALEASEEMAKIAVDMKERRDEGIVSGFINQFDAASLAKKNELTEKYKGQEANKIMPEYQKWRNDYFAKYSSYDKNNSETDGVYLENEAQINMARTKMYAYNVREINSISSYIAREEEEFRVNNLKASISNNSEKLAYEVHPDNIPSLKESIYSDTATLYKGQSKEFIDEAAGKILDDAIYTNIMRDSASNPISSIMRFQNKELTKELKAETREKAKEELIKSFKSYQALQLARAATGRSSSPAGEEFYKENASFFGSGLDSLKSEIDSKAVELRNGILEKDERDNTAVLNDLTVQLLNARAGADAAITDEDRQKYLAQEAGALSGLSGVRGGRETASLLNNAFAEIADYDWLNKVEKSYAKGMQPGIISGVVVKESREEINKKREVYLKRSREGMYRLNEVISDINDGKYESILSIPNFENFSPHQKKEILKSFSDKSRYNSLIETAKEKSNVDFNYKIDTIYKNEYGYPKTRPVAYNMFKREMAQNINRWLSANPNKIPSSKDLQVMANSCLQVGEEKTALQALTKIGLDITFESSEIRDSETIKKKIINKIKDKDNIWFYNKEEEKIISDAADYLLEGEKEKAYNLLSEANIFDKITTEE